MILRSSCIDALSGPLMRCGSAMGNHDGHDPYPYESLQDTGDATTNCLHHKQKSHRHDEHQRRGRHQSTRNVGPRQTDSGSFEPDTTRGHADKDRRHHWDSTEHDPPATWDRRRHRSSSRSADSDPEL